MVRWEVAQGRRRRAHVGRGDRRVAAADAARTSSRRSGPTGKRFVLDRPELRFVVIKRVLERIARRSARSSCGSTTCTIASPNTFDVLSRLRRDAPELPLLIVATARSETLATDLDAALRMEALRARVGRASPRAQAARAPTTPRRSFARRCRSTTRPCARAVEQSRGNPLFALQLLYAWAGGGT